jgi:glucuronoarabinoxylan endo-1,4-beta-xylanase
LKPIFLREYGISYVAGHNSSFGTQISGGTIPANTPVLVNATGNYTFTGTGNVSTPKAITVNQMNGVYHTIKVPANSYVLKTENGVTGFYKVTAGNEPMINPFRAYLTEENVFCEYASFEFLCIGCTG